MTSSSGSSSAEAPKRKASKKKGSSSDASDGGAKYPRSGIAPEYKKLVPSVCDNACPFNCMLLWCCVFLIVPLAVFIPITMWWRGMGASDAPYSDRELTLICLAGILPGLACCTMCFFSRNMLCGGVCCKPPRHKHVNPFVEPKIKTRQLGKPKKIAIIMNPNSGVKKGAAVVDKVAEYWRSLDIEVDIVKSEHAGHAVELGETYDLSGVDVFCIAGGDGSFHELFNGMLRRKPEDRIPVGLIPAGSGNALMYTLGSYDPMVAAEWIARGEVNYIDLVKVGLGKDLLPVYSGESIAWGLVGDVSVIAEDWRVCGPARYDICAVWTILKAKMTSTVINFGKKYKEQYLRRGEEKQLEIKEVEGEVVTAFINNTQYFGKGLYSTPAAILNDGLMDVVVMNVDTRGTMLQVFQQLPIGAHTANKSLRFVQVKKCTIAPAAHIGLITLDGETYSHEGPMSFEIMPGMLEMMIPLNRQGEREFVSGGKSSGSGNDSSA